MNDRQFRKSLLQKVDEFCRPFDDDQSAWLYALAEQSGGDDPGTRAQLHNQTIISWGNKGCHAVGEFF